MYIFSKIKNSYRNKRASRWLSGEDALDEGTSIYSCILARKIPWTEELGGLSQESDMNEVTMHIEIKIVKFAHTLKLTQ